MLKAMNFRLRSAFIATLLTAVATCFLVAMTTLVWYPSNWFTALAVGNGLATGVAISLVVSAALSALLLSKPDKRGLKGDIALVAALVIAALGFATYAMYQARPAYLVYFKGVVDVVPLKNVILATNATKRIGWFDPPMLVALDPAKDRALSQRLTESAIFGGANAADASTAQALYADFEPIKPQAIASASPYTLNTASSQSGVPSAPAVHRQCKAADGQLVALPLKGTKREAALILNRATSTVCGVFLVPSTFPWK